MTRALSPPLLEARGLVKDFTARGASQRAVAGVDLVIETGETVALVGESGCGKTTLARMLVGLLPPSAGIVRILGRELFTRSAADRRAATRLVQMVFQDPAGSLNPRMRVGSSIAEPLFAHRLGTTREIRQQVHELLERVGLEKSFEKRYPHELSGGQRQRVGIARAIALEPKLVIADEPTSALDVSIRVQILNLLADLTREKQMSLLLVSHDLAVVKHYTQRLCVMVHGKIVEAGATSDVLARPAHPHTQELLAAVPSIDPSRRRIRISDESGIERPKEDTARNERGSQENAGQATS